MIAIIIVSLVVLSIGLLVLESVGNASIKAIQNSNTARNIVDRRTIKANEARLGNFLAYQECPKCGIKDGHRIEKLVGYLSIIRKCVHCGHEWRQH